MVARHNDVVHGNGGDDRNSERRGRFVRRRSHSVFFKVLDATVDYRPEGGHLSFFEEPDDLCSAPERGRLGNNDDERLVDAPRRHGEAVFNPGGTVYDDMVEISGHLKDEVVEGVLSYGLLVPRLVGNDDVEIRDSRVHDESVFPSGSSFEDVVEIR